jgi:hypothetical protein
MKKSLLRLVAILSLILFSDLRSSYAQTSDEIARLQAQINVLQKEVNDLKAAQAPVTAPQPEKPLPATAKESGESVQATQESTGVTLKLGGFLEAAALARSKNETTDITSNFNTAIPFNNSVNAHQSEFRGSARQSRLSLLAQGNVDNDTALAAYFETDFLGAAPTANSVESNSYNPRLRQAYATADRSDWGFHFLGGQAWSLLTMNQIGIEPRRENIPLTIDSQYVPGFNWTRNPQIRFVQDFDSQKVHIGLSLESPQASLSGITVPANVNATNIGVSPLSSAAYSTDVAPDIITKVAFDPGWGHYEAFGIIRFFHDNLTSGFQNNTYMAGGGGVGMILPVIAKKLDLQGNIMVGNGIGRYGSAQLPDFAFAPNGAIKPLFEYTSLIGAVGYPTPKWDVFLYGGLEKVARSNQTDAAFGYGDFSLDNSGCNVSGRVCAAQTSSIWQITGGVWRQLYKGNLGIMKIGLQDALTRRDAFSDSNGIAPHAYENIGMISFRYYPF